MEQENRKWEDTVEHIRDAVNILQLLVQELAVNQDDPHIIRSVNVAVKILQAALAGITC
ncbi:MAG: hypothetical protein NC420_01430 [Eubacterium sp.]|nr:hypothetical protein [Eubacterium sp.]MCM1542115.1 hypothetical protein [Blautia sp.]MCM1561670.1 hypothetical protein [Butyrivibrio sp.]